MRLPLFLSLLLGTSCTYAQVSSETIYFLQPDGRSYMLERALRTSASSHRFYLDKDIRREHLLHVEPKDFSWDERSSKDRNILSFDAGGFTVVYPGTLTSAQLQAQADGKFVFRSWNGKKDANGHFGIWYSPDDYDAFTYSWIFPDNVELLSYRCTATKDGTQVDRQGCAVEN